MSILTTSGARVIDPVLTTIAQGYTHVARVGHLLFPRVDVPARGGKVIEFGRESFRNYNSRRAPGADTRQIQFGYEGKPFALAQYALDAPVPREHMQDAQTVPGFDLGRRAVNIVMDSLTLSLEIEQAALATDPASYGADNKLALVDEAVWANPESDPLGDIEAAKEQVRITCGVEPNRMVVGKPVFVALKAHPKIIERFKYTTAESITVGMLKGLFDLDEFAVGRATYVDEADMDGPFRDTWGQDAVLAYVPQQLSGLEQPSYGYTYTLIGHPFVEMPEWRGQQKSWVYGVTYERQPVLTGIASGFLFKGAGAPFEPDEEE